MLLQKYIPIFLFSVYVCLAQTSTSARIVNGQVNGLYVQLQQNKLSAVLLQAENLKIKSPQNLEVRTLLFETYLKSNLFNKAEEELKFIEARLKNSNTAYMKGRLNFKKGNIAESEKIAQNILKSDINFSKSYLLLKNVALFKNLLNTAHLALENYKDIEGRNREYLENKIDIELKRLTSPTTPTAEKTKINASLENLLAELGNNFEKNSTYYSLLAKQQMATSSSNAALKSIEMAISFNTFSWNLKLIKAEILFNAHAYQPLIKYISSILTEEDALVKTNAEKKKLLVLQGFLHFYKDKKTGDDWKVSNTNALINTTMPILLSALELEQEDEHLRFFIEKLAKSNLPLNHPLRISLSQHPQSKAITSLKQWQKNDAKDWFLQAKSLYPQSISLRTEYKNYLLEEKMYHGAAIETEILNELSNGQYLQNYKNSVNLELLKKENAKTQMHKQKISNSIISEEKNNTIVLAYNRANWQEYFLKPYFDIVLRDLLASKLAISWLTSVETVEENRLEYTLARKNPHYYATYKANNSNAERIDISVQVTENQNRTKILEKNIVFSGNEKYFNMARAFSNEILAAIPFRGKVIHIDRFRLLVSLGRIHGLELNKMYEATILPLNSNSNISNATNNTLGPYKVTKIEEMISQIEVRNFFELPKIKQEMEVIISEVPKNN